jgi:tRNA(Ile)-lysidine synthase
MTTLRKPDLIRRTFLLHLEQFIRRHHLLHEGSHIVLGVSGGLDSMAMLDALCALRTEWRLHVSIAHVNFKLRGKASDDDERFVIRAAKKYELPVYVRRADTKTIAEARKESIQTVARELRYTFFSALAKDIGADAIAVAHTAGDNAETMLFNFCRGAGIQGLKGIPVSSARGVIRPFQFATRAEIAAYAKAAKVKHREDASNASDKYARNFLRHRIIPALEERINASLVRTLNTESAIFASCAEYLDGIVKKLAKDCVTLTDTGCSVHLKYFRPQHVFIKQMLVKHCFLVLGIEPNFVHIEEIVRLLQSQAGRTIDCGNGFSARRSASAIEIGKDKPVLPYVLSADCGIAVSTDEFTFSIRKHALPKSFRRDPLHEYIDAATVTLPLTIRSWQPGDSFIPIGMKTRKKVSDFFVDQKISRGIKDTIPVVLSGDTIVWIAGLRLDDRCKITQQTTAVYKLSIQFHT